MVTARELEFFIDGLLAASIIKDSSRNGLQVEVEGVVRRVALGVSVSLELIRKAGSAGAQALVVHHGLFWEKSDQRLRGIAGRRVAALFENRLSLLAYHLPLDIHIGIGNNSSLLRALNAKSLQPFGSFQDQFVGYRGELERTMTLTEIRGTLERYLGGQALQCYSFGPRKLKRVGVVSGGASGMLHQAIEAGLELFITGEVGEETREISREAKISYLALGHYRSEKPGIINLARELESRLSLEVVFIDLENPF